MHGGIDYAAPVRIDPGVLAKLEALCPLAPLHQPHNLAGIRAVAAVQPDLPQVACFDTAFHRSHPELADWYALPRRFYDEGIRRYGFHGLSYEYIASVLPEVAPEIAGGRVVVAHLGSGASMCALENGRSVDSTMGFTALDGLPMGTRCGALDPGVVLHLNRAHGMDADAIEHLLYHDCGLKGVSGISNDMRELLASDDPRSRHAIALFVWRIVPRARRARRGHGRSRWPRVHRRNRRALGRDSRAGLRESRLARPRARPCGQSRRRSADLDRCQPGRGVCHPDRRRADDRPAHAGRAAPGTNCGSCLMPPAEPVGPVQFDANLRRLENKKGLVIGIANENSIAYGCARAFRSFGAELAITYLNDKAKPYVEPLAGALEAPILMPLDVQVEGQLEAVFEEVERRWGRLDFALHSIAFAPRADLHGRVVDCSREGFLLAMDVSCHSFIRMARLAEPLMKDGGALFTMSYFGAERVVENYNLMGPVKAALEASARYLAAELGPKGIRVHAISPGPLKTRAASGIAHFDELLDKAAARAPARRLVTIEDVGFAVAGLATDAAKLITGDTIYIDGGYHIMA